MNRKKGFGIRTVSLEGPVARSENRAPKIGRIKIKRVKRMRGVRKVKRVRGFGRR